MAIVAALMAAGLVTAARRDRSALPRPASETPQDTIYRMYDYAKDGEVGLYLACYDGPAGEELRKRIGAMDKRKASDYLIESQSRVKGIAISSLSPVGRPDVSPLREFEVTLVFADRNELQMLTLERRRGGWVITSLGRSQYQRPWVPYNSPAAAQGPPAGAESTPQP